ncbi:MAG: DUF1045 domain-containing protein [Acidihalobacter sp.]|uniref:DUF1045 domain-containing protein n=1 Tax=Acidihalobacter sp. TaxID=1872108 RepID=UPI00307D6C8F
MSDTARWAIYYAPARSDVLWERGIAWLGRDPEDGREFAPPAGLDAQEWTSLTATPRRYGWHATLKPPMRLRETRLEDELRQRLRAFAANRTPFELPPLIVRSLGGFLALTPDAKSPELHRLGEDCVRAFDDLRAPPTQQELAQRRQTGLSPHQDALLARWGYPYVCEEFRFHLTLTGRLPAAEADRLQRQLHSWFASALAEPRHVENLALYHQAMPQAPFRLVDRFPFLGTARTN